MPVSSTEAGTDRSIPNSSGTYCLILQIDSMLSLDVGRIGRCEIPAGVCVYLGSARGPGGLDARLNRHIRGDGKIHWHIDHLRKRARLLGVLWTLDTAIRECDWRVEVHSMPGADIPIPGFGASDCRAGCPAHLVSFPAFNPPQVWSTQLLTSLSGNPDGQVFIMG